MAMSEEQVRRAGRFVEAVMGGRGWNRIDLAREAGVDYGTVADFLDGVRWPQAATRAKVERALGLASGTLRDAAEGIVAEVGAGAQVPDDVMAGLLRADPATLDAIRAVLRLGEAAGGDGMRHGD